MRTPSPEETYQAIEERFTAGDLREANALASRAQHTAADPTWAARLRVQRGRIALYQGHYKDAIALLSPPLFNDPVDDALAIRRGSFLSIALGRNGEEADATEVLTETAKLCAAETSCAEVRLAQGLVKMEGWKDLAGTAQLFEQGLQSARLVHDRFLEWQFLVDLGVVAEREEHYDEALQRFAEMSDVANALGARLALQKATGNIGWALYKLGDYRRALVQSQRAATEAAALGVPIDQVAWLKDTGLSQQRLGDLAGAQASYRQSLQLARSIGSLEGTSDALLTLATLSLQTGDLQAAWNYAAEARDLAGKRHNAVDAMRPALIEALVLQRRGRVTEAEERLLALQKESSEKTSVQWEVENALAQLAADTGRDAVADGWFRRAIATYRQERLSVHDVSLRLPFMVNGADLYTTYLQHLIQQGKTNEALDVLDEGRAATLLEGNGSHADAAITEQRGRTHTSGDPRLVAAALDATILVYSLQPGTSYLWVVTRIGTHFLRLPSKDVVAPLVERLNHALLQSADPLAQPGSPAVTLFHMLVEPARDLIAHNGKVIIIADGGLHSLNFESLIASPGQPHFWIEDVNIRYARSLALLQRATTRKGRQAASRRLLLMADPVYKAAEYEPLPHAMEEVTGVAQTFTAHTVLTGPDATPSAYTRAAPAGYSHIHFVAHATTSADSPLDSAIVLSADGRDTYKLYARDILTQPLHADLVTLSSCYGSGVEAYAGEGLVGLTWAFLRAGAHTVIAALWQVNDSSTPRLMGDMYESIAQGVDPSTALRSAKLRMVHSATVLRKPYYWAPFQVYVGS